MIFIITLYIGVNMFKYLNRGKEFPLTIWNEFERISVLTLNFIATVIRIWMVGTILHVIERENLKLFVYIWLLSQMKTSERQTNATRLSTRYYTPTEDFSMLFINTEIASNWYDILTDKIETLEINFYSIQLWN